MLFIEPFRQQNTYSYGRFYQMLSTYMQQWYHLENRYFKLTTWDHDPRIDPTDDSNGHIFYIVTRSEAERTGLIKHLKKQNINAVFHYIPLHSSPAGVKYGKMGAKQLLITEDMGTRVVRLPLFYEMSDKQVRRVVEEINEFFSAIS